MEVVKTVTLNLLEPTRGRQRKLRELKHAYREALSFVVAQGIKTRRTRLQELCYEGVRVFGLHSQIASDLFKDAVAILSNGGKVKGATIPCNIPRSGKIATTEKGNPVIVVAALNGGVAIPFALDGAYWRYEWLLEQGYSTTFFRLNHSRNRIHVTLRKDCEIRQGYDAVLGVDIGVRTLAAVSIIS